ncbi:MAG: DUF4918 family protein [Bacteroidales bacterium]|nr:DUF4918 family protein [Bacteroidales bacterium]MBN2758639.1 DUF4918 family protein [Bacteroidales bacterium]
MLFADKIIDFYKNLELNNKLPKGVEVMNPFNEAEVIELVEKFYRKYYSDNNERILILGINPGRFGAGITGIPFTDPIKLQENCKIENSFDKKSELSSIFVYKMINAFGSIEEFYSKFYISSVSPLGFIKNGKNMNYYDSLSLQNALNEFIIESLQKQLNFGINRKICFSLGQGKNYQYLTKLNEKYIFFEKIIPLAHPRYIMQYKKKYLNDFIENFINNLSSI